MTITYLPDRNSERCGVRFHPRSGPQRFCDIVCARQSKVTRDMSPIPDNGEDDADIRDASWIFGNIGLRLHSENLPLLFRPTRGRVEVWHGATVRW